MRKSNPFAQSPAYWKIRFNLPLAAVPNAEAGFEDMALAVSTFEVNEKAKIWSFEMLTEVMPEMTEVRSRLLVLSTLFDFPTPQPMVERVEQQDWLAQVARSFPPMKIGRFYVHGAHYQDAIPAGMVNIQVDAGAAFGSGEHGTTSCCLKAIDWLAKQSDFTNILDMGCGSGILAIAAAKIWRVPVMAADIDEVAVRVTAENCRINRVNNHITSLVSDGYSHERVQRSAPYDLIISNILARPLVAFAPALKANLAEGGIAVLSGLLTSQETMVMSAHRAQGLALKKRFTDGEWCTLVIG
ncbi:MAG: 50S ribosomal protein L11 methyltransferase [Alphaproteobacteria bacterium]